MNRNVFKYIEWSSQKRDHDFEKLKDLFQQAGINPNYYLAIDSSSDLPYDVYESVEEMRMPIYLQIPDGSLRELSKYSDVVEAISRKKRMDHKLYFPLDIVNHIENNKIRNEILNILRSEEHTSELQSRGHLVCRL